MSSIQQKKGKCEDCGPDSAEQPLTAKRCRYHYWKHRDTVKAAERKARGISEDVYQDKRDTDKWFQEQINRMPACCENCGERLYGFAPWAMRSFVAHIVAKRDVYGCPSVKLHPMNRLFLCTACHTNYDTWGADKIVLMKCYPLTVERFGLFYTDIAAEELKNVPDYLLNAIT